VLTAIAGDEPDRPLATGGRYQFAEPQGGCWWPTTAPIRSDALTQATTVYLNGERMTTIPLSQTSIAAGGNLVSYFYPQSEAS
jgi:hypothetical protein